MWREISRILTFLQNLSWLFPRIKPLYLALRRKLTEPQRIWFVAKNFFPCPTLQTCLRIQEMQKFSFYLVRFEIYRQKTKYGPILGLFSKSYNRGLRLIGWTYRIAIFRVDKASEVITFEQKKFAKFGHQVALRQFLIFQLGAGLTLFRYGFWGFLFLRWASSIRHT